MTFQQAEEILGTSEKGLSDEEAARRLEAAGRTAGQPAEKG